MNKFVKQVRFEENPMLADLLRDYSNAFILLTMIAQRANRVKSNITGLDVREALVGDYAECGLTQQKYRTAKKQLEKFKLATFKATSKGTVATLTDNSIYDININNGNEQPNEQVTSEQRAGNEQVTTKKNVRMKECKKENKQPSHVGAYANAGVHVKEKVDEWIKTQNSRHNGLNLNQDKNAYALLRAIKDYQKDDIRKVWDWCIDEKKNHTDNERWQFYALQNVLSIDKWHKTFKNGNQKLFYLMLEEINKPNTTSTKSVNKIHTERAE